MKASTSTRLTRITRPKRYAARSPWVTFNSVWKDTSKNTENQVKIIGTDAEVTTGAP